MRALAVTLIAFLALSPCADGALVFSHSGATDPTTEGWTKVVGSGGGTSSGPIINDLGLGIDAWYVSDTSTALHTRESYNHYPTAGQLSAAATNGWSLSTTLRVVQQSTALETLMTLFRDGTTDWYMYFDMQADGDPVVGLYTGGGADPVYALEGTGSTYHTYSLVYDPVAASADLFVDGVERISNHAGCSLAATSVSWGAGGSNATGRAHFNSVQWDVNGVPEPNSFVILLSGALAFFWLRRKKA